MNLANSASPSGFRIKQLPVRAFGFPALTHRESPHKSEVFRKAVPLATTNVETE
jgi:hypothetical protein